jgi:hypothetical protein
MTTIIKLRRDTAANWTSENPILASGEPGLETDTLAMKFGDGVTTWANLEYQAVGNATFATNATTANVANLVAVANVSGIGNIAVINLDGNAANALRGNGSFGPVDSAGNSINNGLTSVSIPTANGNIILNVNDGNANIQLTFDTTGNLTIPNDIIGLATIDIDNRATGNSADINLYSADDILLQARDRAAGSTSEGGDINISAGDSAEDGDSSGGDITITAGNGGAANVDYGGQGGFITIESGRGGDASTGVSGEYAEQGGDITIRAGDAGSNMGNIARGAVGGDVVIEAGDSTGNGVNGGTIYLTSGAADASALAGNVVIQAGGTWTFDGDGNLTFPGDGYIENPPNSSLDPLNPNVSTMVFTPDPNYSSQSLVLDPTGPGHIHLRAPSSLSNIDFPLANIFLGGENSSFEVGYSPNGNSAPNVFIHSNNNTWTFGVDGTLTFPNGAGFGLGESGQLKVNDSTTLALDLRDTSGRGFYTNNDGFSLRSNGSNTWEFGADGNLTLPANTVAINFANGSAVFSNLVQWTTAPTANTDPGTAGQAAYDTGGNLYVCVTANTWAKFSGTTSW